MKIPLSWLEEYLINKPDWDLILDKLTYAGLEIENIEAIAAENNIKEDKVVELKITPNRGDCLSVIGLLREISALTGYKHNYLTSSNITNTSDKKVESIIDAKEHCPNYVNIVIEDVDNTRCLPDTIIQRLLLSGCKSISPIVDIANYVMLELGQPLHAFDLDKVGNKLHVRMAKNGEELKLLDNTDAKLLENTLIICDVENKPAAIAGVMGGLDSGVSTGTKNIVLESAFFSQDIIAGKAKQYGVTSDAAYRFERGVDYKIQKQAIALAANLIHRHLGGKVGPITVNNSLQIQSKTISLKQCDFVRLIGADIAINQIESILVGLGFIVKFVEDEVLVISPSFRFDIVIKEDVIEEVARVYGYNNIEAKLPEVIHTIPEIWVREKKINVLKNILVSRGYNEAVNYSFIEEYYFSFLNFMQTEPVKVQNPIAAFAFMQNTLFSGLVKTLVNSVNRGATSVRIFELARVFYGEDESSQPLKLSGLIYGDKNRVNWADSKKEVDFFDIKGDVELLLQHIDGIKFIPYSDNTVLHGGRCAKICSYNKVIGIIGQLHPAIAQELGLNIIPYLFELDVDLIISKNIEFKVKKVSKFQKVERDLAFIMDDIITVGGIIDYISSLKIDNLCEVNVFDVYRGNNVEAGKKSVAVKLLFQADKTLTDDEINSHLNCIVENVSEKFQIKLR